MRCTDAVEVLHDQVERIEPRHPSVRFCRPVSGPPEHALLNITGAGELLVVGTPGHGFLDAWRLGAVAHEALLDARRVP